MILKRVGLNCEKITITLKDELEYQLINKTSKISAKLYVKQQQIILLLGK